MLYDTLAVSLHIDDFKLPNSEDFDWSESHITAFITQAMATTDQELESPINFRELAIAEVAKGKSYSSVAYIESNEGYFFVTAALADHLTVVYNRWD